MTDSYKIAECRKLALDFIKKQHMGVLSTVSKNGSPWGSTIYLIPDNDLNYYFVTKAGTLKYKNIKLNPKVAITVADDVSQTTVQAFGVVSKVPIRDVADIALDKLSAIQPQNNINWAPPYLKVHKGDWMVLKFTPKYMQFADFSQRKSDIHDDHIVSIL